MGRKKGAAASYSGFFLAFEPLRTEVICERLFTKGEISESFSAVDWELDRRELALLCLDSEITVISGIALMERMHGNGGTGKLMMRIHRAVVFAEAVTDAEVRLVFQMSKWLSTAESLTRIPLAEWNSVIDQVKTLRPDDADAIDRLIKMQREINLWAADDVRLTRLMEQRDAIGLAMDIAAIDRKPIFRNAKLEQVSDANSVLDLLDGLPMHEQDVIRHDEQIFAGLLTKEMRGVRFRDDRGHEVRVHVFDKKSLETVLGIDLLIFQEAYRSFILLQYKMMEKPAGGGGETWLYRCDAQLDKQMEAMEKAQRAIAALPLAETKVADWRLREEMFFVKFCQGMSPDARDDALARGITMCHSQLKHFLSSPESNGPKGGKQVGYGNCSRYLNNSQFVDLAAGGWIGCGPQGYEFIRAVLAAGKAGGRSAMLAVIKGEPQESAMHRKQY